LRRLHSARPLLLILIAAAVVAVVVGVLHGVDLERFVRAALVTR
jgi:hypothetical protein